MTDKIKENSSKGKSVKGSADRGENTGSPYSPARIKAFIGEVKAEFKKIVWPERKVTTGLTGFVILLVVIISIYLGSVDLLLGKLVTMVLH